MSLPSGYKRMEYIKSSGTQWIDTGFNLKSDSKVVLDCNISYSSGSSWDMIFGAYDSSAWFSWWANGGYINAYYGSEQKKTTAPSGRITLIADGNNWTANGTTMTINASTFTAPSTAYIFSIHNGGSYTKASMKLYSCQIYDNGTLVRDFIPCQTVSGEIGLWDDVNSLFYANAGTGTFTAGPTSIGTHKVLINGTEYEVKGGKCLVNGTSYDIKKGRTLIGGTGYDITFAPSYDPVFANNTWEQIIAACHNNEVPDTWKVADHKPMTINGVAYQIDIIGKNHDDYSDGSGKAPLTFQLHDCYGEIKNMNSSNTNSGGWTSCAMRGTHLPAILALMPTEVQNGIRDVNKMTSAGSQSATINTTADKLFLLSEIEIYGSTTYSFSGEGTQYDYYKTSSNRRKKVGNNYYSWWGRSPNGQDRMLFCSVSDIGKASSSRASFALGVPFAFCF